MHVEKYCLLLHCCAGGQAIERLVHVPLQSTQLFVACLALVGNVMQYKASAGMSQ